MRAVPVRKTILMSCASSLSTDCAHASYSVTTITKTRLRVTYKSNYDVTRALFLRMHVDKVVQESNDFVLLFMTHKINRIDHACNSELICNEIDSSIAVQKKRKIQLILFPS